MNRNEDSEEIARKTDQALDQALREVLATPDRKALLKNRRRRWFGVALIALTPFCLCVAKFLLPTGDKVGQLTWIIFSLILLFVGAWQIDRAAKDEENAELSDQFLQPPPELDAKKQNRIHKIH